jgi:N-methylhydantoinase B
MRTAHGCHAVYHSTVDADGFDEDETHIECTITVSGPQLHVDYAGTSSQIDRGLNSVMNYTYAYTVYPIKCALDPLTPRNERSYRTVSVDAPIGSILNPHYPAPCNARQLTGHLLAGAIYGCLAQVVRDKVIAERGGAPTLRSVYSGVDRQGNSFSQILFASGGIGAGGVRDGNSCTAFPTNSGAGSIEAFESNSLIVWKNEFRQDSGGARLRTGGYGLAEDAGHGHAQAHYLRDRHLGGAGGQHRAHPVDLAALVHVRRKGDSR